MEIIKAFLTSLKNMCDFSKGVLKVGFFIMVGYYISVIILCLTAEGVWGITSAFTAVAACLEAAPAAFVASFAAAAICDIATKSVRQKQE